MKNALVVGAFGQDGQLLSEFLEKNEFNVLKLGQEKILYEKSRPLGTLSLFSPTEIQTFIKSKPLDEIYYLAAHHHSSTQEVGENLELFNQSYDVHVKGLHHFLESMRLHSPQTRLFYASSSLVFGSTSSGQQTEKSAHQPDSSYALTKSIGQQLCSFYRNHFQLFVSSGLLYNHESILRKPSFFTKRLMSYVVKAQMNLTQEKLTLGSLDHQVDWSHAEDFVHGFHMVLNSSQPDDFIFASGQLHSVEEFVRLAFSFADLDWRDWVAIDKNLVKRPTAGRWGRPEKLWHLGWKAHYTFEKLVEKLYLDELALHPKGLA